MKRRRPKLPELAATVDLPNEPDWIDITERVRATADGKVLALTSESKITGDVKDALARGVRIRLNNHQLWVDPALKLTLRMTWEVLL